MHQGLFHAIIMLLLLCTTKCSMSEGLHTTHSMVYMLCTIPDYLCNPFPAQSQYICMLLFSLPIDRLPFFVAAIFLKCCLHGWNGKWPIYISSLWSLHLLSPTCVCFRVMIFYHQLGKYTDRLVVACSHAPHTTCAVSAFHVAASIYSTILDLNTAGRHCYMCFN